MSWWRSPLRLWTTAKVFGVDPKVAFLSYSTLGSGKGEDVDKMRNACEKAKAAAMPDLAVDGELQFRRRRVLPWWPRPVLS